MQKYIAPSLVDVAGTQGTCETAVYTTTEALTAGDWVEYDLTETEEDRFTHIQQANAGGLVIGVALEDADIGDSVTVAIGGYCKSAMCPIGGAGATLQSGAGGIAALYAAASLEPIIGRMLTNVAGAPALSDVWIEKRAIVL